MGGHLVFQAAVGIPERLAGVLSVESRSPGLFRVDYLERGPAAWRIRFVHA
jgi:uncharacterized protein (DUF2249 family)